MTDKKSDAERIGIQRCLEAIKLAMEKISRHILNFSVNLYSGLGNNFFSLKFFDFLRR